jgi:hypothetical protein
VKEFVCLRDEATVVGVFEVDVDVPRQRTVFVPNTGRSVREGDFRRDLLDMVVIASGLIPDLSTDFSEAWFRCSKLKK